ncbi:MAG: response regulator [Planctomycetota bacterium]
MKITILDDNEAVLRTITAALKQLGYAATGFTSPAELEDFVSRNRDVSLMIFDQLLESADSGWNIARAMREKFALQIPVLMVTAYPGADLVSEITRSDFAQLLTKPFGLQALADSVQQSLTPAADH